MTGISKTPMISADSHVIEDFDLLQKRLPASMRADAPVFPERQLGGQFQGHSGGFDPAHRIDEMAEDDVFQEVLYPSFVMNLFGLTDAPLQEACFYAYNDWLIEYCSAAPDHLFGIGAISTFDIDHAVEELERVKTAGLRGAMIWEVPPAELSFQSDHYEKFWRACEVLDMPISLHSLTGIPYVWPRPRPARRRLVDSAHAAATFVQEASFALSDLIATGALERFPQLKIVIVESEASWIPFFLSRCDNYATRPITDSPLSMAPSEYFFRQVYSTFFNDPTLGSLLPTWGLNNLMWSSDFPHMNSTWPNSRDVVKRDLGHLSSSEQNRLVRENVRDLYNLPILANYE